MGATLCRGFLTFDGSELPRHSGLAHGFIHLALPLLRGAKGTALSAASPHQLPASSLPPPKWRKKPFFFCTMHPLPPDTPHCPAGS